MMQMCSKPRRLHSSVLCEDKVPQLHFIQHKLKQAAIGCSVTIQSF